MALLRSGAVISTWEILIIGIPTIIKDFYITEERIKEFVEEYEEAYGLSYGVDEVVYWVTGHSRGAAISIYWLPG